MTCAPVAMRHAAVALRSHVILEESSACSVHTSSADLLYHREHPANEVYVTGTFDDWSKSEKLDKIGDIFVKKVTLSDATEKIYYKVR